MAASARRRGPRLDLIALAVVAVGVAALLVSLVTQMQSGRQAALAETYPQLTQPPPTVAIPTTAFIGDSYTAGTGSSGSNARFATLVTAYEGWFSENFANGGTGYLRTVASNGQTACGREVCQNYDQVLADVQEFDPLIVVVSGGRNDVGLPQADVATAIEDFYTDLRAALPDAQIYATSPVWAWTAAPAQLTAIQSEVREQVEAVGGTYLDIGDPLVDDRSLVSRDRVHPNNSGHAALAQAIEVAISQAEQSTAPASETPATASAAG